MKNEEIDRALASESELVPSSGFAGAVMEAVRFEDAAPPPIPFPWKCAIPGLAAWAVAIGVSVLTLARFPRLGVLPTFSLGQFIDGLSGAPAVVWAGWTALALVVALACVKLSMRLAGVRS